MLHNKQRQTGTWRVRSKFVADGGSMAEAKAPHGIVSKKFIRFGTVTPFPKKSFDFCARFLKRDVVLKMWDFCISVKHIHEIGDTVRE